METLKLVAVVILSLGLIEADPWSEDWMLESTTSEPYTVHVENITAHLGQDVTVDCQAPGNYSIEAVNWTRPDLAGRYVFYYRDGHMDPGNQHPSYKNRVQLVGCLLNCSSLSFIMLKVRSTDYATYRIEIKYIDNGIKKEPICIVNLMPPGDPDGDHLTTSPTTMNPATASPTTMNLTTMNPATASPTTQNTNRNHGTLASLLVIVLVVVVVVVILLIVNKRKNESGQTDTNQLYLDNRNDNESVVTTETEAN